MYSHLWSYLQIKWVLQTMIKYFDVSKKKLISKILVRRQRKILRTCFQFQSTREGGNYLQ